ncbi:rhomboid family intramembrane serine protease [Rhodococcus antarcticus]|uniref:Rhomboid family intramembrane serine protease n=1 Tax=Rhodococcus antarcticus TaxID=2987751 RepID=A0ABY6NWU5_9NOCA|nr:rhomboid family intramembrane serine protease [Rhodococcus antarcticus]UZJ23872.1 rhomboid family intramembrane serine protease [Rhodococcus antarcticus]
MTATPTPSRPVWRTALLGSVAFVALLWVLEVVDQTTGSALDAEVFANGITPRDTDGLVGILLAPLLHGGFGHLAGNTVPLLVLGFLLLLSGVPRALAVTAVVWLTAGAGVWLVGAPGVHLGASVLVFGWLAFLLVRGVFARNLGQVALGLVLLVVYGGVLWGVLPGDPGVSWEGHLFGALGGIGAAAVLARPR